MLSRQASGRFGYLDIRNVRKIDSAWRRQCPSARLEQGRDPLEPLRDLAGDVAGGAQHLANGRKRLLSLLGVRRKQSWNRGQGGLGVEQHQEELLARHRLELWQCQPMSAVGEPDLAQRLDATLVDLAARRSSVDQ